jgi:hypothetical protein
MGVRRRAQLIVFLLIVALSSFDAPAAQAPSPPSYTGPGRAASSRHEARWLPAAGFFQTEYTTWSRDKQRRRYPCWQRRVAADGEDPRAPRGYRPEVPGLPRADVPGSARAPIRPKA